MLGFHAGGPPSQLLEAALIFVEKSGERSCKQATSPNPKALGVITLTAEAHHLQGAESYSSRSHNGTKTDSDLIAKLVQ